MDRDTWLTLLLLVIFSLGLAGCQPRSTLMQTPLPGATIPGPLAAKQQPAANKQPAANDQPVAQESTPASGDSASQGAYPYPPPNLQKNVTGPGAGVVDNQTQVTARLVSREADPADAQYVHLRAEILTSQKVFGPADFTAKFVNKEMDLYALAADLPALSPGDQFEAKVWYRPQEPVRQYNASEVKKLP